MATLNYEISIDSEAFEAELMKRLALMSGTQENLELIVSEIINDFITIEEDILAAEFITEKETT